MDGWMAKLPCRLYCPSDVTPAKRVLLRASQVPLLHHRFHLHYNILRLLPPSPSPPSNPPATPSILLHSRHPFTHQLANRKTYSVQFFSLRLHTYLCHSSISAAVTFIPLILTFWVLSFSSFAFPKFQKYLGLVKDDVIVTGVLKEKWSPDVKDARCDFDPVLVANYVRRSAMSCEDIRRSLCIAH
nr:uncharacterized protein LOC113728782 [Coffea arabica]